MSWQQFFFNFNAFIYRYILRPILFLFPSEFIHEALIRFGQLLGEIPGVKFVGEKIFFVTSSSLKQTISGINFPNPVGLSAGFDYEARLPEMLPAIGFGFGTIGTITKEPYEGNARPRLGRLVKSQSLMVNKGLRNLGIDATLSKMKSLHPTVPVGISIGPTNKKNMTLQQAIDDITFSFRTTKKSKAPLVYYELNISCPNLLSDVNFYQPKGLQKLLAALEKITLSKPLFIKMPIHKTDKEILLLLDIIVQFSCITGVIFGNLQKNRQDPSLNKEEVKKYPVGYFSGKPTEKRSNELIALTYKKYKKKLVIIGCGGIFSAEDAYKKIRLGASLVQLITGLIFQGPQLPAQVSSGLQKLLREDGFSHISEAVGIDTL